MSAKERPSVAFDELEEAMSLVRQRAASCYLHRSTGEVVTIFEDDDDDDELSERIDAEYDAYVSIPAEDSARSYGRLVEFAEALDEEDIRARLEVALNGGKGAFRRFRDVVSQYPDLRARFDAHMHAGRVHDIKAWLEREGLDLELRVRAPVLVALHAVAPPRAREPDLVDLLMLGGRVELLSGKVRRFLLYPTEGEARAAFTKIARQVVEHCGHAWRKRYVENTSELEMERFRLVHDGCRIELFVDTDAAVYLRFAD